MIVANLASLCPLDGRLTDKRHANCHCRLLLGCRDRARPEAMDETHTHTHTCSH